jgi:tetratricopeptide (TPR) repeat protein
VKPETWARVRILFERSLELEPLQRAEYLEATCADRPEVRAEVERLLREDDGACDFLSQPVACALGDSGGAVPLLKPGSRLGTFVIGRVIASGGMGTVYEALQDEPRRTVALKTLRRGLTTPGRMRRFRFEAEVLGSLRHPGIAQVYASGTHASAGRSYPYFAMEFVERARDLLVYANEHGLSRERRLELFLRVCDALQHAHAKGVIHRDLKGGNILVDSAGHPKVIDFGIARLVSAETEAGSRPVQALGTPATMSPEHVSGRLEDVDVRSDVYSLACVLHELLSGRPPRALDGLPTSEVVRRIREEPPSIDGSLPAELRWILTRALATDPERRYAGAAEFAGDLRRHLAGEPVEAAPRSALYTLRKLAQRHRWPLIAAGAVLVALALGLVRSEAARRETAAALARARRAEQLAQERAQAAENARSLARRAAQEAHETLAFFERSIENVDPQEGGRSVLLADVLDRMAASAGEDLAGRPQLEAAIRASVGRSLRSIGLHDEAEPHLERAHALREEAGVAIGDRARSRHDLGFLRQAQGRLEDAQHLLEAALEAWDAASEEPQDDVGLKLATLNRLATVHQQRGRFAKAEALLQRGLDLGARHRSPDDREVLMTGANLGIVLRDQGRAEEGIALLREVVETSVRARGDEHPDTVLWKLHLAAVLVGSNRHGEVESLLEETLESALRALGDDHPYSMQLRGIIGRLRFDQGRFDEAAAVNTEILRLGERRLGEGHPSTLSTLHNLAMMLLAGGRTDEAEQRLRLVLVRRQAAGLFDNPVVLDQYDALAKLLSDSGRWDEAEALLEEGLETLDELGPQGATIAEELALRLRTLRSARSAAGR